MSDEKMGRSEFRVAELVETFLELTRAGKAPGKEAFVAEHPDLADALREALGGLELVEGMARHVEAAEDGDEAAPSLKGQSLGHYRIAREIGRGGMGVVYEAEDQTLQRRVALKVLPAASLLDPKRLQRFRHEAQAAAQLHHTNIVPVYGVGSDRGTHYYAMQYIEGINLAEAIGELKATASGEGNGKPRTATPSPLSSHGSHRSRSYLRAACRIGIQAAEGLDYAHQVGVVHRDIKPANIMLDASGHVWIMDFGLAQFEQGTHLTQTGDLVGTFRYMSPEQALAKRVPIDHRTDVYSLGASLYELVTLEPAVQGDDAQTVLQSISFKDPVAPRKRNPSAPPELETILLKAMAKDPAERYETAQELADDLRRFLDDRPIVAKPPNLAQRATKWARRHRGLVGAAVVLLLLTTIGLVISTTLIARERNRAETRRKEADTQREEARRQAAIADAVLAFLTEDVLAAIFPEKGGRELTLRQVLDAASARIEGVFADEPLVEAHVRYTIGSAYLRLGSGKEAERHLSRARDVGAERHGAEAPVTLHCMHRLANAILCQGRYVAAEALHRELLATRRRVLGEVHRETLSSMNSVAVSILGQGRYAEAEALLRELLPIQLRVLGEEHRFTLGSMLNLATALAGQGRHAEAEALYLELRPIQTRVRGPEHPDTLALMANLGKAIKDQGRHADAEALLRELLPILQRVLGEEYPSTLVAMHDLAEAILQQDRPAQAEALLRELLPLLRRARGEEHRETLQSLNTLAAAILDQEGRRTEAEAAFRHVLAIQRRVLGEEHQDTLKSLMNLATTIMMQGRNAEAEPAYRELLAIRRRVLGEEHADTLVSLHNLAASILYQGRYAEAEALFRSVLAARRRVLGEENPDTLGSAAGLGLAIIEQGRNAEAEKSYRDLLAILRRVLGEAHRNTRRALHFLAVAVGNQGRDAEAAELHREVLAIQRRVFGERHSRTCYSRNRVAWLLATTGDGELRNPAEAVELALLNTELAPADGNLWNTLGVALYAAGRHVDSLNAFQRSMNLGKGGDAFDWFFVAMAKHTLGQKDAREWYDRAVAWMEKNMPDDEELKRFGAEAEEVLGIKKD